MSNSRVPALVARPVRGAAQVTTAYVITEFYDSFFVDLSEKQYGALVAMLAVTLSFAQILVENSFGKAFLRQMPERDAEVVEEDGGAR